MHHVTCPSQHSKQMVLRSMSTDVKKTFREDRGSLVSFSGPAPSHPACADLCHGTSAELASSSSEHRFPTRQSRWTLQINVASTLSCRSPSHSLFARNTGQVSQDTLWLRSWSIHRYWITLKAEQISGKQLSKSLESKHWHKTSMFSTSVQC